MLCAICIAGCQDTKTKKNSPTKTSKVKQQDSASIVLDEPEKREKQYRLDTIKRVDQVHLIPFLKKFGAAHSATYAVVSTRFGDIKIKLFTDTPLHRANFIRMAELGYFNTTYFYRVIEGFVIQAGNSDNEMTSRMRKLIGNILLPSEFKKHHLHSYGAVSMSKYYQQNVSKASSPYEFFIVMDKNGAHHLDFEHTVFGKVVQGMEVAEKISQVKTGAEDWPMDDIPITVKIIKPESSRQ